MVLQRVSPIPSKEVLRTRVLRIRNEVKVSAHILLHYNRFIQTYQCLNYLEKSQDNSQLIYNDGSAHFLSLLPPPRLGSFNKPTGKYTGQNVKHTRKIHLKNKEECNYVCKRAEDKILNI